jgi:flagellum-specific peptidoglycan hydrolase FlgJ
MAQIALETRFGTSELFRLYNNVGGIKAVKNQPYVVYPTWEYINDVKVRVNAKFAKYNNLTDGLVAYSKILLNRNFKKYANKTKNPKVYVRLLQGGKPKYATDINYIPKIDKLIDLAAKV